jgi:ribosomal protein L20
MRATVDNASRTWSSRLKSFNFAIEEFGKAIRRHFKFTIDEFDKDISVRRAWIRRIKAESRRFLCEYMQFDTDFQEEFN